MSSYGIANSTQLATLTKAVDDYCAKFNVTNADERERIAIRVFHLFQQGIIKAASLSEGLEFLEERLREAS
ncbi:hypothetical protein ACSBOB_01410 [Mesorhizobium sp. ASY16-5R]|uniref:hypothetical protein n=1 Tax=Mesorhizobium sp. ASY16-5R TaxID=3445772 RepID=UPI003FA01099